MAALLRQAFAFGAKRSLRYGDRPRTRGGRRGAGGPSGLPAGEERSGASGKLCAFARARRLPRAAAWTVRLPYSAEERQVAALLLLPFLLLASALAISHSVRRGPVPVEIAAVSASGGLAPSHCGRARPRVPWRPARRWRLSCPGMSFPPRLPACRRLHRVPPAQIAMLEVPGGGEIAGNDAKERGICVKTASLAGSAGAAAVSLAPTPEGFGMRLAQAARAQVDGFVIYDDKYRSISYPMGDVPFLFGVCTDVVVRAYRALGLDLQGLVQQARSGSGDRSIDHRRTEVLRRFFAARGESLPVTSFAEDYLPGDIVTYYRPQNRQNPVSYRYRFRYRGAVGAADDRA